MNRTDFGKLIASLRSDLGWTQAKLAEVSEIDIAIISQIERGVKKHFDPEQLVQLADALQMTTFERRGFFLASSGVAPRDMVRPDLPHSRSDTANAEKELKKIEEFSRNIRIPAFVLDPYYDFVMANPIMLALFGVDQTMVERATESPLGFNSVHLTFGKDALPRLHLSQNWEKFALNSMRGFREMSVRYRATPYFEYLLRTFSDPVEYPFFARYWKMAASMEEDKEYNLDVLDYVDHELGHMKYLAAGNFFMTAYGDLHFVHYEPMEENTAHVFAELADKYGTGLIRFASWPEKKFPQSA